jgi:uncharacterized membrane protein
VALLVILLGAVLANTGVLPAGSTEENPVAVYEGVFRYLAPLAIFWLLLPVNLNELLRIGFPMILLFLVGSFGTVGGVMLGMWAIGGSELLGDSYAVLAGMFAGTYTGGSINFNAVALHYGIVREGGLYAGAVAVDNVITTIWMILTLALPRLLAPFWPAQFGKTTTAIPDLGIENDTESLHPQDVGMTIALGTGALWLADLIVTGLSGYGYAIPEILVITILALLIAQLPAARRLRGAQVFGMFSVYLFLAVIGAFCDFSALAGLGWIGLSLLVFALITVAVHGLSCYGVGRLLGYDPVLASVASQANVGGGTSALALARSLGRVDLVLPAILLGALGNALGTFLGFWVVQLLS